MKIETTPREDHQITMTVEIEADKMQSAKKRSARQLAKRGKIPGFRPGKAPYQVIVQNYGEQAVVEGAIDILLDEVYPKALNEAKIEPGAQGTLEEVESLDPPKFVFVVPLQPEVELGDYRSVRMDYEYEAPGEEALEEKLAEIQRMYTNTAEVERPIEIGDYIKADVIGKDGEEVVFEHTEMPFFVSEQMRENEVPFSGFAQSLVGTAVGESKSTSYTHAEDDEDEELRGKEIVYEATIKVVHGTVLPDLDDEFAQKLGLPTFEALEKELKTELENESRSTYDDEYFTALIDKIKEGATIKYPPQVLTRETEYVVEDIKQRLAQQGMEFDAYLKMKETTLEAFTAEEAQPVAQKRLERSLLFDEIARSEKLELAEDEIEQEFNQTLMSLAYQGFNLNELKGGARAQREIANNVAQQSAAQVMTRKTLDRMKAIATGEQEKAEQEAAAAEEAIEEPKEAETSEVNEEEAAE